MAEYFQTGEKRMWREEIDDAVIERAQEGDSTAHELIVRRYHNDLIAQAMKYFHGHEAHAKDAVQKALEMIGIDSKGLTLSDRMILKTLIDKYNGGPVGLNTIAASLSEDQATIEEFNEPYLIQLGFIERTPRGRVVTDIGYKHIDENLKDL
jgi:Holliday junction DNA helicase RuvB